MYRDFVTLLVSSSRDSSELRLSRQRSESRSGYSIYCYYQAKLVKCILNIVCIKLLYIIK